MNEILNPDYGFKGVMVGRSCYETPWIFSDADR